MRSRRSGIFRNVCYMVVFCGFVVSWMIGDVMRCVYDVKIWEKGVGLVLVFFGLVWRIMGWVVVMVVVVILVEV